MARESVREIRRRLAAWVAEKISGKRYAEFADEQINALQLRLGQHRAFTVPACWCEHCDLEANGKFRTRMSLCPECGDKRCPRSVHHDNACRKTPNAKLMG